MTQREFYQTISEIAREFPHLSPQGTAAHAANEARWGQSELARVHNNLWGIKATGSWDGAIVRLPTWEVVDGHRLDTTAVWRVYDDWRHCLADYADIIGRLYPFAAKNAANPVSFLAGLFLTGPYKWATDPHAFHKALTILDAFEDAGVREAPPQRQLGEHALWVDNSPTIAKGFATILASLSNKPAVHEQAVRVTRTPRAGGAWKLDLASVED